MNVKFMRGHSAVALFDSCYTKICLNQRFEEVDFQKNKKGLKLFWTAKCEIDRFEKIDFPQKIFMY